MPHLQVNHLAVVASVVVTFFFGWIWYGPLFGKTWAALNGFSMDRKPAPKEMMKSMALNLIGLFFTAHAIACLIQLFHHAAGPSAESCALNCALCAGFSAWLGFKAPMHLNSVAWEQKSWKLFALNAVYTLLNLEIMSVIIGFWK